MSDRSYICIDLKSFYASVECVERGLDPMRVNLVVADPERSDKTICLAITPAMKALGIRNRCRVFEIPRNVQYITAPPRMQLYIDYAADIYGIYLKYISPEDIHVYSIDEAFMDVTDYLSLYHMTAKELGRTIIQDIYNSLGIRATCGVAPNLFLTKVALDITAKHSPDFMGVLDYKSFRELLWDHTPLTDFWQIGEGTARRLADFGITTMRGIAEAPPGLLYKTFGVDAELLIDHANGIEPVTIADIKAYRPKANCISSGQVLMRDYVFDEARLIVKEMTDLMCLDMVDKNLVTHSVTLHMGYSNSLHIAPAHGTVSLDIDTNADIVIIPAVIRLFDNIADRHFSIRRINITFNNVISEECVQYSFFCDPVLLERNRSIQKAVIDIKNRYGRNLILKGMNLCDAATTRERNMQIGGHKSG